MYRSSSYASQASKSAFVEISERSGEAARLLSQARDAEPAPPATVTRTLSRRVLSQGIRLLEGLENRFTQLLGAARG